MIRLSGARCLAISANDGALSTSIVGGLFVVAGCVIATDVLTRFFKAIWLRIEPPGARGAPLGRRPAVGATEES